MKINALVAVATCIGLGIAGLNLWLCLATALIWLASAALTRPVPEVPSLNMPTILANKDSVSTVIEPLGTPLLLLEQTRILAANVAARTALGAHVVGQDARIALRHPDAVALLDGNTNATATVKGLTTPKSVWDLGFFRFDGPLSLIELSDRTIQSDQSRAHTDFVANASHELRTPLASIIGYVETLLDPDAKVDKATSVKFLETVRREANRMHTLVADLLSLSRIEAEKHDRPLGSVNLDQLTSSIVADMRAIEGPDRVLLEMECDLPEIIGDSRQIDQVIRNLVENGLKYGAPEEPVTILIKQRQPGRVSLSVVDRGAGISAEHLPHLTRRFYRMDTSRSRSAGGTGLGLAIVKHIVERHRGRLNISSEEGVGTIVEVDFPVIDELVTKESRG